MPLARPWAQAVTAATVLTVAGALWAAWLTRSIGILAAHADLVPRRNTWLFDWNVYHAAALDLMDRTLYRVALVEPGHALPIEFFNYPPLAAAWAVPLLPFGREPGGVVWVVLMVLATSAGSLLGSRAIGLSWIWTLLLAGVGLALYSYWPHIVNDILLANNNHLVFGLMGGFALAHVRGHERVAGILLALAVGTKLWPVALIALLLRERRWREMRWLAGGVAVQGVLALAWLGPDVIGPMLPAIVGQNVSRGGTGTVPVLWTSWARAAWDWWPDWGGYAVASVLLVAPFAGLLGLGLGIIGGLSLNLYLWHHYAPVFGFGAVLVAMGTVARVRRVAQGVLRRRRAVLGEAEQLSIHDP
jgi:hypothetical protein